jgi:hypothetical protein
MRFLFFLFVAVLTFPWAYGANPILHYEPAVVELTGIIEQQTFPGPPNYESIANGDEIEKGWYLQLSEPVEVVKTKNDDSSTNSETERNVKIMQLTWDDENPKLDKAIRNSTKKKNKVRLKGDLFHRLTGHHHSKVLMSVDQLNEIRQ